MYSLSIYFIRRFISSYVIFLLCCLTISHRTHHRHHIPFNFTSLPIMRVFYLFYNVEYWRLFRSFKIYHMDLDWCDPQTYIDTIREYSQKCSVVYPHTIQKPKKKKDDINILLLCSFICIISESQEYKIYKHETYKFILFIFYLYIYRFILYFFFYFYEKITKFFL